MGCFEAFVSVQGRGRKGKSLLSMWEWSGKVCWWPLCGNGTKALGRGEGNTSGKTHTADDGIVGCQVRLAALAAEDAVRVEVYVVHQTHGERDGLTAGFVG